MPISASDLTTVRGISTVERSFQATAQNLPPKIALLGYYDNTIATVVDDTPVLLLNANDAGTRFGFGTHLHRLAKYAFSGRGSSSVPIYAVPVADPVGATASERTITVTGPATAAGSIVVKAGSFLADDALTISIANGDDATAIGAAIAAAITANSSLPFSATAAAGVVTLVCKTKGAIGEGYAVVVDTTNAPAGTTFVVASSVTATGTHVITDALAGITASNIWFTDIVAPEYTSTFLAAADTFVGNPNNKTGKYDSISYTPCVFWFANTAGGSAGLSSAITVGDNNKGIAGALYVQAPSYKEQTGEICAYLAGTVRVVSASNPAKDFTGLSLALLGGPVVLTDDWTTDYASRNLAIQNGLAFIKREGSTPVVGDLTTLWHPADNQNGGFKWLVNQCKIWNIANSIKLDDARPENFNRPIVSDAARSRIADAIDTDMVRARIATLAGQWASRGWIYTDGYTIENMIVSINDANPDRIDKTVPVILSGNNRIEDTEVQVDRNLAIVEV